MVSEFGLKVGWLASAQTSPERGSTTAVAPSGCVISACCAANWMVGRMVIVRSAPGTISVW